MTERSPYRARASYHFPTDGVRVAVGGPGYVRTWPTGRPSLAVPDPAQEVQPEPGQEVYLELGQEEARALYEALAEHFGHGATDTRALRREYEAERARVDSMLGGILRMAEEAVHRA